MIVTVLLFTLGLVLLIKGGDWFVDGATGIAHHLHIPELLIGATVVSIGTTLPEVMVSSASAVQGHGEIAYGNALGSVICNTALIAALTVAIRPTPVSAKSLKFPVLFFFIAAIFYSAVAILFNGFSRLTGIVLLIGFVIYIAVSVMNACKMKEPAEASSEEAELRPLWKDVIWLIIGAALIAWGADLLVKNATIIAKWMGVPEAVIGLTLVALGTSLPELVTAITSLVKGHSSLSLGNIIGANLFNLVLVSGLSVTLAPFDLPSGKTLGGISTSIIIDIPVMLGVMAILTLPALFAGKLSRTQGVLLLGIYVAYCAFQFL